jgi:cellulose synthase/poly-beta-1,6-N-acetylglucosamine synthase-like glycosyltransferase
MRFSIVSRCFIRVFNHTLDIASEPIISDYTIMIDISMIIEFVLLSAAVFYLIVHFGLTAGLKRLDHSQSDEMPFVSVIVAARNEEKNIRQLLQCLSHQTYSHYEIIVVNDRSTDNTADVITRYQKNSSTIKRIDITNLQGDMPAKKNALKAGIDASKGEILCFTDADCSPPPQWIEELVKSFKPNTGLVAGYSPYHFSFEHVPSIGILRKVLFKFIEYEEYRAAVWAAGSIGWNLGWLCTGRNLAYRRKVFDEVDGFDKIKMSISGDDDLFLQLVRKLTAWKINYVNSRESFIPTVPSENFWSFVEQRKRHFSAAKFFSLQMKLFFFLYHSSNLVLLLSPFLFVINLLPLSVVLVLFISKFLSDIFLFTFSHRIFDASHFRYSFILMEVLYILYNSLIGPLGIFRKFTWKQS